MPKRKCPRLTLAIRAMATRRRYLNLHLCPSQMNQRQVDTRPPANRGATQQDVPSVSED